MPYVLTDEQRKRIAKPSIVIADSEDENESEHVQFNLIQPSYGEQINDSPPAANNEASSPILNGFTQRSQLRNSQQLLESQLKNSDSDGVDSIQLSKRQSINGSSNNTSQGLASRYASGMSQIVGQNDKINNMPIQNGTNQMLPPSITNDSNSGSRSSDTLNLSNNSRPTTSRDFSKKFKQYNNSAQQKHTIQSLESGDVSNSNNTQHVNQTNEVDHNNNLPPSQSDTRRKSARTTPPINYNNTRPYNNKKSTPNSTNLPIHIIAQHRPRESS